MLQKEGGYNTMWRIHVFKQKMKLKVDFKEVKYDSRNVRPSTNWTEVNVSELAGMWHLLVDTQLEMNQGSVWKSIAENLGLSEK